MKKDISKRKTPFFCILKGLSNKQSISLKRKKAFQKEKCHSSVFWKAFQISRKYFSCHMHFKCCNVNIALQLEVQEVKWYIVVLYSWKCKSSISFCKTLKTTNFYISFSTLTLVHKSVKGVHQNQLWVQKCTEINFI